jgi:hypothetical protein
VRRIVCLITLLLLAAPVFGAAATEPSSAVQKLINDLADPDASTRQSAAEKLVAIGDPARQALVMAARSNSPQIASRASEILMKLPWWDKDDPDDVKDKLQKYGELSNEERAQALGEIAKVQSSEPALLRIAEDDPSDSVSWIAVALLRELESEPVNKTLRQMDLTDARLQVVLLAARAYLPVDRAKAMALFRQAIEQDAEDTPADDVDLDFAYRLLITDALEHGNENDALKLQRLRVHRAAAGGDASGAVFELLALYADHGITDSLEQDLEEDAEYLGRPEVMYTLARLEDSREGGSILMKDAINRAALASSLTSAGSHWRAAKIMQAQAWDEQAWLECYSLLAFKDPQRVDLDYEAHQILAEIADTNEDHVAAADHWEAALPDAKALAQAAGDQGINQIRPEDIKDEVAWHRLHAARTSGDHSSANKILDELLQNPRPETNVTIEVVNALKSSGRNDDAVKFFQKGYDVASDKLAERDFMANNLNEFAWICARCGERADEAVKAANRAMAIEPENYAYIDTAASAYFAAGDSAKAVELERRALLSRPNDAFMRKQLERFESSNKGKQ